MVFGHDTPVVLGAGALLGAGVTYMLMRGGCTKPERPGQPAGAPVYLDHNASTPIDPEAAAAMQPYLWEQSLGNPSSNYFYGRRLKTAVETSRAQVAELLNAQVDECIFTSGGSMGVVRTDSDVSTRPCTLCVASNSPTSDLAIAQNLMRGVFHCAGPITKVTW